MRFTVLSVLILRSCLMLPWKLSNTEPVPSCNAIQDSIFAPNTFEVNCQHYIRLAHQR